MKPSTKLVLITIAIVFALAISVITVCANEINSSNLDNDSTVATFSTVPTDSATVTEPISSAETAADEISSSSVRSENEFCEVAPENFPNVPHYFQTDYPDTPYGNYGTVKTHGCGITSLSMVITYLLDEEYTPDKLAAQYGSFNTKVGSDWMLFPTSAEDFGVTILNQTYDINLVIEALENKSVIIAACGPKSVFTDGGHFVVLSGITSDGKILVQDPNRFNYGEWSSSELKEGFANGFDRKYFNSCGPYWIYAPKGENPIDKYTSEQADIQSGREKVLASQMVQTLNVDPDGF